MRELGVQEILPEDVTKIENITKATSDSYGKNPKFRNLRDVSMPNIPSAGEKSSPGTGKIEENTGNGAENTKNTGNTGNTAGGTGRTSGTGRTGGMRFSVAQRPYYQIPFAESVDKVINGEYREGGLVFVSATPAALRGVHIPALPIMMTQQHIRDIYNSTAANGRNAHGLGEQLKALPQMLENPVAILAANKEYPDARAIVITRYMDKNGNKILVPVIIGSDTEANGGLRITANIATSAYGKRSVSQMLQNAVESELNGKIAIFGANKKITSKLPMPGTPIVPGGGFNVIHNIDDSGSPVKGLFKKNTKTLQFKRWFGSRRKSFS